MKHCIIVGGVAGGATAAAQLRRINPGIRITIYEKGRDISFGNCGLPYNIGGEVSDRNKLIAATPESMAERDITVKTYHEVLRVDSGAKKVTVKDSSGDREFEDEYDYLILSPGGAPKTLPALLNVPQAFVLHNLGDLDDIKAHIDGHGVDKVVLIGAGYIGLELIENFVRRGMDVTFIHRSEEVYRPLEDDMGDFFIEEMERQGVDVRLNAEIVEVTGNAATLDNGEEIDAPLIVAGIGILPRTEFLKGSGIKLNDSGFICTGDTGRTSVDCVYALGDAIETFYQHTGGKTTVALAWGAHRMAYVIANQISGNEDVVFEGLLGTNIMRFFDYDIATLGLEQHEVLEYDHFIVDHRQRNKAGYMDSSVPIHVRIYVSKTDGKILRAAVVGTEGVDKRIDILAAHIRLGGTAADLANIEVAYSPPYSSPKSVLNMIGYKTIEKLKQFDE